ncbi:MAG: YfhO family protein [Bacteroidia bacterium]
MAKNKKTPKPDPVSTPSPEAEIASKEHATVSSGPDFFEALGKRAIWICAAIISLIAFFVFRDFLMFKKTFLYKDIGSDTLNGMYPYMYYMSNYIAKNGIPAWSFTEGMGQSIFAGTMRDPMGVLFYVFGSKNMPQVFIYSELIKLLMGGLVFFLFLKKLNATNFSAILGGVLFSYTGFMVIGACWYLFTYEALCMATMLLGFEKLYQEKKWLVFTLSIFMICLSMPFFVYFFGMFLAMYVAFRLLLAPDFSIKKLGLLYGQMILCGLAGILLSAPFLLETLMQIVESPRGSGGDSYFAILSGQPMFHLIEKEQFGAFIMRLFSSDMLGSGNNYAINGVIEKGQFVQKNWGNFLEAPFSYCGIISLVLFPQVIALVEKPKRKWYIAFLLFVIIPTIFPYFRYLMWLFTGDYYREFSFFLSLILIIFSVLSLDLILKKGKLNVMVLGGTVLVWLILESYPYFKDYQRLVNRPVVDETISMVAKLLLVVYGAILFLMARSRQNVNLKFALIGIVAIELIFLTSFSVNRRDVLTTKELGERVGYNDYTVDAVSYLKQHEKAPFYRMDKVGYYSGGAMHGSLNDQRIQGYYSTSSYNSFAQINFINYLRSYGVIGKGEYESRWVNGLMYRQLPILESLNNVKYIVAKATVVPTWRYTMDSINKFGDVILFRNKFALPFGYTYDTYMRQSNFDKLSNEVNTKQLMIGPREFASLAACVIKDEDVPKVHGLKEMQLKDTVNPATFSLDYYKSCIDKLKQDSLNVTLFSDNKIQGTVDVSADKVMYLSFPYDKGWHLKVDGQDTEKLFVSNGMTGIYLSKGKHTIDLEYHLRFAGNGVYLSLAGLLCCGALFLGYRKNRQNTENQNDNKELV